jgi:hypothetical protein
MQVSGTTSSAATELLPPWEICQCKPCRAKRVNEQPLAMLGTKAVPKDCEAEAQRKALAEWNTELRSD